MSTDSDPTVWLAIGFGAGIVSFFRGFKIYREYHVVEDTPQIPIRSMAMGLVNVQGKAIGEELVTSPVARVPCYFYKVDIERWKHDRDRSGWTHYRTDTDGVKFYLEDESGKVLVDAKQAELDLAMTCEREVRNETGITSGNTADAELLSYVSRVGASGVFSFLGRGLGALSALHDPHNTAPTQGLADALQHPFSGAGLSPEMTAFVSAMMEKQLAAGSPGSDPKQELARRAMLDALQHPIGSPEFMGHVRGALAQFPHDPAEEQKFAAWAETMQGKLSHPDSFFSPASGRFRLKEYCIVPGQQYDVTGTCAENPAAKDEHDRNMIMKGRNEPTYLISDKSRAKVESSLRNRAALMALGGAALSVVCLGFLLARLGWW